MNFLVNKKTFLNSAVFDVAQRSANGDLVPEDIGVVLRKWKTWVVCIFVVRDLMSAKSAFDVIVIDFLPVKCRISLFMQFSKENCRSKDYALLADTYDGHNRTEFRLEILI